MEDVLVHRNGDEVVEHRADLADLLAAHLLHVFDGLGKQSWEGLSQDLRSSFQCLLANVCIVNVDSAFKNM